MPVFPVGDDADNPLRLQLLTDEHEFEVLDFLAERPLHTPFMAGLIHDNGLSSVLNRGSFYGCRNSRNELEGVSLLGYLTLVEARTDEALRAFARFAQILPRPHVNFGERPRVNSFWKDFAEDETPRLISRYLLLEQLWLASSELQPVEGLCTATLKELYPVMRAHAAVAMQEAGVNPLHTDPVGYRQRVARRIGQNRLWVCMDGERVIFKADIAIETPETIYLEGVYVAPEKRGKGFGSRCFSQLCRTLLARAVSICLVVDEHNEHVQQLYFKTGFEVKSHYTSFFVESDKPARRHMVPARSTTKRTAHQIAV
jgi:ribosomal protein S18 acetylase RimI-like enzyme